MKSKKLKSKRMIKKIGKIAIAGMMGVAIPFISIDNVHAQKPSSKKTTPKQSIQVIDSDPMLISENISSGFELVAVDSMLLKMALNAESQMYPADELYDDAWDTEYVKAYGNLNIPDNFTIDVKDFVMPVEGRVTSNYGPRRRRFHYGTDIKLQTGDTVRAAFDGKIRVKRYERRGYGYYLVLRHPNGLETVYGHLSKFLVDQDQVVKAGEPIALGGNTGRSSGAHLHLELRFLGQAINPAEIIDFNEFCTKDEMYVFEKSKSGQAAVSSPKYAAKSSGKIKYYRIKAGDNLGSIAKRNRTTVSKLCKLNNIKATTTLRVGRSIRIG